MFQDEVDHFLSANNSRLKGIKASSGANLFSPVTIELKKEHYELIEKAIRGFFSARNVLDAGHTHAPNYSVLMSYDFHITDAGPKLIEINTNAGQSLFVHGLYQFKKETPTYLAKPFEDSLRESFFAEASYFNLPKALHAAITDDKPDKQFFYPEFLLMADQMVTWGWRPFVCDANQLKWERESLLCDGKEQIHFVYNRLTDFYLKDHPDIGSAYKSGKVCVSPTPTEYDLLANKNRLVEFSQAENLGKLIANTEWRAACLQVLPKTLAVNPSNMEELQKDKKKYFFKPMTAYGGKGVYRGESASRKIFEEILHKDYLAQEFVRAPEIEIATAEHSGRYKYDVRFYVYKDQIQLVSARLYQGQVTNFRSAGAGLCTVELR